MEYLVDKETRQILIDAWFDEDERLWLTRGGVCWINGKVTLDNPKEE